MNWRTVDKRSGCWIFCHGVVGFVFSNGTNFDVSTPFLMGRGGAVSVRERCPRWSRSDIPVAYVAYFISSGLFKGRLQNAWHLRPLDAIFKFHLVSSFQLVSSYPPLPHYFHLPSYFRVPQAGSRRPAQMPPRERGGGHHAWDRAGSRRLPPQRPARTLPRPGPHAPLPNAPPTGPGMLE